MGRPLLLGCRLLAGASRLPMARIVVLRSALSLCCHFAGLRLVLYGDLWHLLPPWTYLGPVLSLVVRCFSLVGFMSGFSLSGCGSLCPH